MYSNVSDETFIQLAKILGGEEGVKIINVLMDVEDITVEELTTRTEIQINTVRKLLYKFYNHSLVSSKRFRDKETGWFIFQWKLQPKFIEAYIQGMKQKILKRLQTRLEHELQHNFYYCGSPECPRVTFEDAMDIVFHCPTCNVSLKSVDNTSTILFLENKIADIEKEVKN